MSDIADAGGVSRPALYLMFDNKEHLFRELARYRVELALHNAKAELVANRVVNPVYKRDKDIRENLHRACC